MQRNEYESSVIRAELVERRAEIIFLRSIERELRADRDRLLHENDSLKDALTAQIGRNELLEASFADVRTQRDALKQSLSWRITVPLRTVLDTVLKMKRR